MSVSNKTKVIIVLLVWLNVVVLSAGQVTLTSSLDTGQRFSCPGEKISYICSGSDPLMSLYAPPLLSQNSGGMFAITESPGSTGFVEGPFTATLLSVNPLTGQLTIDTSNISLVNLEVVCQNSLGGGSVVNTERLDVNEADGVSNVTVGWSVSLNRDLIYSNWTAPSGNFDIDYYEVSVFRNDEPTPLLMFNTTSTSMTATYTAKLTDIVFARIVVISKCGVRSGEFTTNDVSPRSSESVVAIIVFMVTFLVAFLVVLVALIVVLVVKGNKNR